MNAVEVELHASQLGLLDELVERGHLGSTRGGVLREVLVAHVNQRLGGGGAWVGGESRDAVLESSFPRYGAVTAEVVLQPVTGKALPVRRGQVLRIEQVEGGTCVDFNAFNLDDHKEFLSCGFTRGAQSFDPRKGELIWTNAPRGRPMWAILEMAETCALDIVGHRCNRIFNELWWGTRIPEHPNCQDTLAEAIREYGLTPDDVHDSFNLWMSTTIDADGRRRATWNPARKGDRVEVLALFDVLAAVCICGIGDLFGLNNFTYAPIKVEVLDATPETERLVGRIEERWGRLETQAMPSSFAGTSILMTRPLEADPGYVPSFRPLEPQATIAVELSVDEQKLVDGFLEAGAYGETPAEVLRATFMRWCNSSYTLFDRPRLVFTSA